MIKSKMLAIMFSVFLISACSSTTGGMPQSTGTAVDLNQNNYKVVKAGALGSSWGFKLLGFIPIVTPTYASAKSSLYRAVGEPLEGRPIALANQTEDQTSIYLILFSLPKITITADVIEFNGPPKETK